MTQDEDKLSNVMNKILPIILAVILSGCAQTLRVLGYEQEHTDFMNGFIGYTERQLIQYWARPPMDTYTNDGIKYLTWRSRGYSTHSEVITSPLYCVRTFLIDTNTKSVISWSAKGNNCYL